MVGGDRSRHRTLGKIQEKGGRLLNPASQDAIDQATLVLAVASCGVPWEAVQKMRSSELLLYYAAYKQLRVAAKIDAFEAAFLAQCDSKHHAEVIDAWQHTNTTQDDEPRRNNTSGTGMSVGAYIALLQG